MAGDGAHHAGHKGCDDGHDHHSDVTSMVELARRFAASRKIPFTEMRARVLTVLARKEKPLTAYEIVDRLRDSKKVQAVQVYRARKRRRILSPKDSRVLPNRQASSLLIPS
jgi:Fe2+ or Zn2+ uptake regulation protein